MSNPDNYFKPGESGNPNGRPKRDWTVQGLIEEAMEEQDQTGVPAKKAIYQKLVALAKRGDIQAVKEINQRLDGMPQQKTDVNLSGQPIIIKTVMYGDNIPEQVSTKKLPA